MSTLVAIKAAFHLAGLSLLGFSLVASTRRAAENTIIIFRSIVIATPTYTTLVAPAVGLTIDLIIGPCAGCAIITPMLITMPSIP